ncbi:MAG: hypothetical protein Q7T96_16410 [Methylobacter sp.]|nr:hypothetical protein [Methylobacter sp.]
MQTYLPFIKAMLSEWYLFTLNNALYAAVLAATVWLLTALLYSFRIAAIKRGKAAGEKAAIKTLNDTQQQLRLSQEELATSVEQMENAQSAAQAETQRALALEQLIYQRNQQIAGTIQTLATSFDLGERPLLASEDVKADSLWQQHDKVIMQLIERLRTEQQAKIELQQTCQTATAKLAEKESLLNALKSTLDNHTNQLSKLEQALEEQKSMLQQQNDTQLVLSDTLKNFQPAVTSPAEPKVEPKPEIFRAVNDWQQPIQITENTAVEEPLIAQPEPGQQVEQINAVPEAAFTRQVEETPMESVRAIEEVEPLDWVLDDDLQPVARKTPSASSIREQQAVAPSKGSFGKIKGLFGKQPAQTIEPQPAVEEDTYASLDMEQQPVIPAKGSVGKIKNLFGKKQQPVKTEPQWIDTQPVETVPPSEDQANTDQQSDDVKTPGKLKGFYSKLRSKDK